MHNESNPSNTVNQVHVKSDGRAFTSELKAKHSKIYKSLNAGSYKTNTGLIVRDYGVYPNVYGYDIYVVLN